MPRDSIQPLNLCLYGPAVIDGRHGWKGQAAKNLPTPYDTAAPRPQRTGQGPPESEEIEGIYSTLIHRGWFFVSWWDRSGDGRFNCWMTLAYPDDRVSAHDLFAAARDVWPYLFPRLPYMLLSHEEWCATPKCSFCGGTPRSLSAPQNVGGICGACALRAATPEVTTLLAALLMTDVRRLVSTEKPETVAHALVAAAIEDAKARGKRPG